ncbi:MAG: hypothetical protein HY540_04405 [Deltaproteobacteria bacterium]|nr:hypothetical protein [Deltaproteobacteria bacterium]
MRNVPKKMPETSCPGHFSCDRLQRAQTTGSSFASNVHGQLLNSLSTNIDNALEKLRQTEALDNEIQALLALQATIGDVSPK